jgi:hypothetical protein
VVGGGIINRFGGQEGNKEGEQLEDRRNVGKSGCNYGDGTDQRVQSLMFMMMMMMMKCVHYFRGIKIISIFILIKYIRNTYK